jgi:hypothetical protein
MPLSSRANCFSLGLLGGPIPPVTVTTCGGDSPLMPLSSRANCFSLGLLGGPIPPVTVTTCSRGSRAAGRWLGVLPQPTSSNAPTASAVKISRTRMFRRPYSGTGASTHPHAKRDDERSDDRRASGNPGDPLGAGKNEHREPTLGQPPDIFRGGNSALPLPLLAALLEREAAVCYHFRYHPTRSWPLTELHGHGKPRLKRGFSQVPEEGLEPPTRGL